MSPQGRLGEGHHALHPEWIPRPHYETQIGDLKLESGETIADCRLVWVEHGTRNPEGTNTILALCAIGSTHHRLDFLIGEGLALDPGRFHVVAVDALGNGLSSSPSNSERQPGADFPSITIRDMVESQRVLLDKLGVTSLHAVVGASMGGMQALQWAASFPERVRRVVAMTAPARTSAWSKLANELSRRAMFEDEPCRRPRPRADALRLWAPLTQVAIPMTPGFIEHLSGTGPLSSLLREVESRAVAEGPDAFDWLCQTHAYDAHDLGDTPGRAGGTEGVLRGIMAPALLLAPPLDLYNPADAVRLTAARMPNGQFLEIPSRRGHRSASPGDAADVAFVNRAIREFIA